MKLVAQRVVRPSDQASGINAYCYLHPGVAWLDAPPADLGRGVLVNRLIEVPPGGNRIRSHLDITTPDGTSADALTAAVLSGADLLAASGQELPWQLAHGGTAFSFNLEAALVEHWSMELRILLGYALQVRSS